MNEIYLHRSDIESILEFMDSFPEKEVVLVTADTSSGIGTILKAHITGVTVGGQMVTVVKDIVDESSW
jgi:hypothetical protein